MITWHSIDSYRDGFVSWYLYEDNRQVGEVVCLNEELGTYYAELAPSRIKPQYFTDVAEAKDYLWTLYALERAAWP